MRRGSKRTSWRGSRAIGAATVPIYAAAVTENPSIELLWWEGCPSTPAALAALRAALAEQGRDPESVVVREIRTDEQAAAEAFMGSPTIRVGGNDLFPAAGEPAGLTCRIYRLGGGRPAPPPAPRPLRPGVARGAFPR